MFSTRLGLHGKVPRRRLFSSRPKGRLILVRHGQSEWNVTDPSKTQMTRFTGWANVQLTEKGREGARQAGHMLHSLKIDCAVTSRLDRARETLDIILDEMSVPKSELPITSSWRLNERHYGMLVGLSKAGAERIYGKQQLERWRHDWATAPPPMNQEAKAEWEQQPHCQMITSIRDHNEVVRILEKGRAWCGSEVGMPTTESLADCCRRVLPFWEFGLAPRLQSGETVLLVGHANVVKSLLRVLDSDIVTEQSFSKLKIPNSTPLVYTFEPDFTEDAIPGDLSVIPFENSGDEMRHQLRGQWLDEDMQLGKGTFEEVGIA